MSPLVLETHLSQLPLLHRGKVRDVYDCPGEEKLLIVSTDRLSAFDYILPTPIPEKGKILTQLSLYWFGQTEKIIPNHFLSTDVTPYISDEKENALLEGRSMVVKKASRLSVEAVVRGYIAGSAWKDYQKTGRVSGIKLSPGLKEGDALAEPIFTPTTKANVGEHDVALTFEEVSTAIGESWAKKVRDISIEIFKFASEITRKRGLILVDTKFEFGLVGEEFILIDEVLTPDSSRFWLASEYQPGRPLNPWDKQLVRDYLLQSSWDRKSTPPLLPEEIVRETQRRYVEILNRFVKEV